MLLKIYNSKAYIDQLEDKAIDKGEYIFSMQELREIGKGINLSVGDFHGFIEG